MVLDTLKCYYLTRLHFKGLNGDRFKTEMSTGRVDSTRGSGRVENSRHLLLSAWKFVSLCSDPYFCISRITEVYIFEYKFSSILKY